VSQTFRATGVRWDLSDLFASPDDPRLAATLRDLAEACGEERPAAVCRELTKIHETVTRGTLGMLRDRALDGSIPARGEIVVVIGDAPVGHGSAGGSPGPTAAGAAPGAGVDGEASLDAARSEVEGLVESGISRADAARDVAARTGLHRRALYGAPGRRSVP